MKTIRILTLLAVVAILAIFALLATPVVYECSPEPALVESSHTAPCLPPAACTASLLALPVGIGSAKRRKARKSKKRRMKLTASRLALLGLGNATASPCDESGADGGGEDGGDEGTPSPNAGSIVFYDPQGRPMQEAPNAGTFQQLTGAPNAVVSLATARHERLSTFAVGLEQSPLDAIVDHFFPPCEAPALFDYLELNDGNEQGVVEDDHVGASGKPRLVEMAADGVVQGKLLYRGLGTPYSAYDQQIDQAMPGSSIDRGREKRTRFVHNLVFGGRAKRAVAKVAAAAGAATGVSIGTTDDPVAALRPYIETVADEVGSLDLVRLCIGATAYSGLLDHSFLVGGGSGNSRRTITREEIARLLEIPVENILVCRHKVISSAAGRTKAKSYIRGADQLYISGAHATPNEFDKGFGKSFYMGLNGQRFDVVTQANGIHGEEIYLRYFELMKATNTSAIKRLAISYT